MPFLGPFPCAQGSGAGHGSASEDGSFASKSVSGSSSSTGAGTSTATSTSGSASSSTRSSKMNSGVWTPLSGKQFSSDHGKSKDKFSDGGDEKSVVVGDTITGTWSVSDNGYSNYSMTVNSVLGAGGQWTTTGTATESGGGKGSASSGESGTESLKNTAGQGVGSITIKGSDDGHSGGNYHAAQAMTKDGGWTSVSGSATSTSGSTSTSTDNGGGGSDSTTAGGDSSDSNWSVHGNENAHVSENVTSKLGSGGIWITQGSITISGGGSSGDSASDTGKIEVGDDAGSSSGSGVSDGSSSGSWETGSDTATAGSGSGSSNNFNATYSLDANGNWDAVSGSMFATNTVSSHDSINGSGDFGFTLPGGSDIGTWYTGGGDHSSSTATVNATLNSDGSWTTTGTDTGGGGGSWSSGFGGGGSFSIDTGSVSSGNWDNETGTVTESGSDNGGYSDSYQLSLANGAWQGSSGSASANDTATADFSDDETDSYGEDTSGGEVTGTKVEDDSVDATGTANASWTLGTDGSWVILQLNIECDGHGDRYRHGYFQRRRPGDGDGSRLPARNADI